MTEIRAWVLTAMSKRRMNVLEKFCHDLVPLLGDFGGLLAPLSEPVLKSFFQLAGPEDEHNELSSVLLLDMFISESRGH